MNARSIVTAAALTAGLLFTGFLASAVAADAPPAAAPAASAPPAGFDQSVTARLFKPVPGKAVIYVMRDLQTVWAGSVGVYLDGQLMGTTRMNTYFRWEVAPGSHVLVSATVPMAVLELKTEPGGIYYVWQDINPGFLRAPSALREVDLTTAQAALTEAVLRTSTK